MATRQETGDGGAKIPLGVPSIDGHLGGGVRPGTSILASGPFGAGHRELLRTAAVMHGNWLAGTDLFDLQYGDLPEGVVAPTQVRYVTVNDSAARLHQNVHDVADAEWVRPAFEHITVESLAEEIATLGPIRPDADGDGIEYRTLEEAGPADYERVFHRFEDLVEATPGEIIIVDALSDFLPVVRKFVDADDVYFIAQTLCHLAAEAGSVLLACADTAVLSRQERGLLKRPFEALLDFGWFGEGSRQRRTMTVSKFPEFWHETNTGDRVTFDVDVDTDYFGLSSMEKIPPSRR